MSAVQLPEFLKIARPDSGISAKEVGRILNLSASWINALSRRGEFPKPDYKNKCQLRFKARSQYFWRADTIRKYLRERAV